MNWFNYIPLLIVFIVVFRSVTKEIKEKKQETMKTDLPHHKGEKEIHFPGTFTEKMTAKNEIWRNRSTIQTKVNRAIDPETFSATGRLNNDFFSIEEIDEIRRAIVYAEIFNKKFYDS